MVQTSLLAKIGADTADNDHGVAKSLPTNWQLPYPDAPATYLGLPPGWYSALAEDGAEYFYNAPAAGEAQIACWTLDEAWAHYEGASPPEAA